MREARGQKGKETETEVSSLSDGATTPATAATATAIATGENQWWSLSSFVTR